MSKIATIPVFSSIVAILFFLNCQRWDYISKQRKRQYMCWCQYKFPQKGKENSPPLGII